MKPRRGEEGDGRARAAGRQSRAESARRQRRVRSWLLAVATLALTALAAACGGNDQTVLERELQVMIEADVTPAMITREVQCPETEEIGVNEPFICEALIEGQPYEVNVTFVDAQRRYELTPRHALLGVADTEVELAASVGETLGFAVQANCGSDRYLIAQINGVFRCSLERVSAPEAQDVNVTVLDAQGTFNWELAPAPAPTGS